MEKTAFCSVAFGDKRYIEQQVRLNASIREIYPDAPIYSWTNEMPPGSRSMSESLYGFKPWAVRYAYEQGYQQIMFFDPACILMKPIDYYEDIVQHYGVLAAQDDNKLINFCSDAALEFMGMDREKAKDLHLVGGSFYYFDFGFEMCHEIFNQWIHTEVLGFFGSQKDQASGKLDHGHRNDEAMMALSLYDNRSRPLTGDVRYNCENKEVEIIAKKHFK